MKHTLFSLLFLVILYSKLNAQNFWAYTAGGLKEDETMDICYDNSGNIISTGYFSGPTNFSSTISLSSSALGIPDIYVSKSNSNGQILWAKRAGGNGSDRATSIASDASGNIFITGFYFGTATFGSITLTSLNSSQDGFIAKLDPNGNFIWAKSFGGSLAECGNSIAIDITGNPIVTGQFQGTANFSGTNLTSMVNPLTAFSSFDIFVAKYSATGNIIWVNQGKAKYDDKGLDIVTDNQNNIYVCGQFSDTIQFQYTHNNAIMNSIFIIKYDATGQEQWFKKAAGLFSIAYSMALDNSNHIYITGDFQGTLTYFGASGSSFINGLYTNKAFLMKIDNNGNFIWGKSDASNNYLSSKNVALDANQDPYMFGEFGCTHTEYSATYGTGIFNSIGFQDFFITKYNNTGTRQWFRHYGGPRNDKARGLLLAGINEPIMSGSYEYQLNIPSTNGTLNRINNYSTGAFSVNQPVNYCSANNNYTHYYDFSCNGYSDAFIFKGIDLTRNPYDYYDRSGTNCNLNFVGNCITSISQTCPDTINICLQGNINSASHTNYYHEGIGPIQQYIWNNNANDTLDYLPVNISGYNTVKVSTLDGCYTSYDTVYVKINPLPPPPTITDSYGINTLQPPLTNSIHICGPSTITLTGGGVQNTTYNWSGPYISTHDSVALVNSSSAYTFNITDQNGCMNYNWIDIIIDSPIPSFNPKQKNDTVEICMNSSATHIICDSISNPAMIYPYSCIDHQGEFITYQSPGLNINPVDPNCDLSFVVNASATGNYTYTVGYVINNLCIHDTIFFTGNIYIIVKPIPQGTMTVSGNTNLCPGDTALVTVTGATVTPNTNYSITPTSQISYTTTNLFFYLNMTDTISGCSTTTINSFPVTFKSNPFIILNPYNGIICPNDSVKLTINLTGATSYEWHGPSGIIPLNNQFIYVKTAGYYHCIVTDSAGCIFTTNSIEVKQYASPYLIGSPNNIICNNKPINLHVVTLDSTLITWNAPLSGSGATKLISNPGVYSCQVTMCGITTSLSINVIGSNPVANITPSSTTACPFDSILLSGNPGMSNYIWQPGNHSGQNYTVHTAGSYSLEVIDIYGCTATSTAVTLSFTSNIAPPSFAINDTVCSGQTAILTATNSTGYQTHWFPNSNSGPLLASGNTYTTPIITNQTSYYASSVSPGGCHSSSIPVTAYIYPTSVAPVLISDTTICFNDPLSIMSTPIAGATYSWTGPGITSNTTNVVYVANATNANAGLYTFQTSGFGCTSPTSSITIYVLNPIAPIVSANDSICENSIYVFAINPVLINYTYDWTGPNSFSYSNDSLIITNATLNHSGTYSVTSNLYNCKSQSSTLQLTVLEIPQTPTIVTNAPICVGDTLFLNTNSNPNYTFTWFGENGFTSNQTNTFIINADTSHTGSYSIIATNVFCPSSPAYNSVSVIPYPTMITSNDTIGCDNTTLFLNCQSSSGNYVWNTGSTSSSIPVHQSGTYWVSSQNGICTQTDTVNVSLISCSTFSVNTFTPNGDGINDLFRFNSTAIKNIHCEIFNRWGQKVGEFNGRENGWDGKNIHNNIPCSDGTYFYIAEITTIENVFQTSRGFLTLLR